MAEQRFIVMWNKPNPLEKVQPTHTCPDCQKPLQKAGGKQFQFEICPKCQRVFSLR